MSNTEDAKLVEEPLLNKITALTRQIRARGDERSADDMLEIYAGVLEQAATIERLRAEIEIRKAAMHKYAPCGGCAGKAPGGCLMCRAERAESALSTARTTAFREAAEVVKAHRQKMPVGIVDDREWDGIQANNSACDAIASAIDAKAKEG